MLRMKLQVFEVIDTVYYDVCRVVNILAIDGW